jgi:hypothetical protein
VVNAWESLSKILNQMKASTFSYPFLSKKIEGNIFMRKIITAFLNYFSFSFLFRLFFHLKTAWHLDTLKGAKGFGQKTKGEIPPFDPCLYVL